MKSKGVPALIPFLILISAIFIGILIWAYVETKKANPQMIQVGQAVGRRERLPHQDQRVGPGGAGVSACHPERGSIFTRAT